MFKRLTRREKIIVSLTAALILACFVFDMLQRFITESPDSVTGRIRRAETQLHQYQSLVARKDKIMGLQRDFYTQYKEISTRQELFVKGLSELENLAKQSGIKILEIRPQGGFKNAGSYDEALIDLRTEGSFKEYLKFIYWASRSLWLFDVRKIQLTAGKKTDSLVGSFSIAFISVKEFGEGRIS